MRKCLLLGGMIILAFSLALCAQQNGDQRPTLTPDQLPESKYILLGKKDIIEGTPVAIDFPRDFIYANETGAVQGY